MKIIYAIAVLMCFGFTFGAHAQTDEKEDPGFDYGQFKNEFSVDLIPIINGDLPARFFYRRNYTTPNGRMMAFRMGLGGSMTTNPADVMYESVNFERQRTFNYQGLIGLEFQKSISPKFIGYQGVDFIIGETITRFDEPERMNILQHYQQSDFSIGGAYFWGAKYHILPRLSVFAEMALLVSNNSITNSTLRNFDRRDTVSSQSALQLRFLPIRNISIAYHF
ncbi:hypothetical protein KI659_00225 [Litoribacter alkaliphilus]|uniref:Outer membrane beta-barrel protein n=1 Tax=Litoribacter ruber TaxID=702568 RepID=A0AAP2CF09_9BACT|nr:hypothetical protein [Litoribacter alkaliphilus]MBS9522430.1 hypothetical protein [Litoribacter alkaliphilus]